MQSDNAAFGKSKRTNSLAFAQTDCYTCASVGERCDRRRPQCSTCLGLGRKCGGFATPLSWDPKRMWSDSQSTTIGDASSSTSLASRRGNTATDPFTAHNPGSSSTRKGLSRPFRFVKGTPKPRKRRKVNPPTGKDAAEGQSGVQGDQSSIVTNTVPPREVDENLELMNHSQTENCQGDTGMIACLFVFRNIHLTL